MWTHKIRKIYLKFLSNTFFVCGLLSILASLGAWLSVVFIEPQNLTQIQRENAERFSLFIGLWAPTLLILSMHVKLFLNAKK